MPNYRRLRVPGGTYFFTVNLLKRHDNDLLIRQIALLRRVIKQVKILHPFHIHGWVILPEHMHCMWELPADDDNFPLRWRLIKMLFCRELPHTEYRSQVRKRLGERGIWQRHYWEHVIRDERDYRHHFDYIHINPVKHGLVKAAKDWPYSTFHHYVRQGVYPLDWCCENEQNLTAGE